MIKIIFKILLVITVIILAISFVRADMSFYEEYNFLNMNVSEEIEDNDTGSGGSSGGGGRGSTTITVTTEESNLENIKEKIIEIIPDINISRFLGRSNVFNIDEKKFNENWFLVIIPLTFILIFIFKREKKIRK